MTDRELAGCARLGQQADPPHMIQPPGCNYTPDEVGRMLGNRVVQPHYAAWLVRKALLNIGLIDAEAARQQHAADQATIAALREELNRRAPSSEGDGRDGERLDWLCAVDPARRVEGGMGFRAYEDVAPLDVEHSHWVALTDRFYGTAREAIDAAIAAAEGSE